MSEWTKETLRASPETDEDAAFVDVNILRPDGLAVAVALNNGNITVQQARANAARIVACWNAMRNVEDPATFMAKTYEILDRLEDYLDKRSDVVDGEDGQSEPNEEMQYLTAVRELLAIMEKNHG